MRENYIRWMTAVLFLALLIPVILLTAAINFPVSTFYGLAAILVLAILIGSLVPRILISWLIIILTTIGCAFLLLGYVMMTVRAKILLLIAFPIEATLVNILRHHFIRWRLSVSNKKDINNYVAHYDPNVKLQTSYNANKIYQKQIKKILRHKKLNLWTHVTMIRWANHQQFGQYYHIAHAKILAQISTVLKQTRLTSELLFYLGDGTFLIVSPELDDDVVEKINQTTQEQLKATNFLFPIGLKFATEKIDQTNAEQFSNTDYIARRLKRSMETDIVVEYLKEDN